ncbi:endonuclease domain-containing protein [candidate division NPL-UPA2 bacterium Unc8]|uniref:Endonuclease domain-containing protein n=1 Tax=candidate division NPL-UPA2 bacterium Unc8 TaxID=1980939 RepID=A0A399FYR9_UNCN2|nr:hypothetical protein [Bacillota bacterium]MBT9146634.1 hypothetical protein [Bacillota bacterium]RII00596.1 MAG: endonuclease domain-containing protein [candidate division NPL-UPA2 bacterium Unc8]
MKSGKKSVNIARNLRKNFTDTERYLWKYIRRNQLEGFKFRRQQPIGRYIVDFVNFKRKIVIEVDGGQHAIEGAQDRKRDKWLRGEGFEVLRFWDHDVLENIEGVLEVIRDTLLLSPHPNPLPQGERE